MIEEPSFPGSRRRALILAVALTTTLAVTPDPAGAESIPFDSDRWVMGGGQVVEHDGRPCLVGSAYVPDVSFENGIIEFDLMVDGSRGYPGITFRATSPTSYEHLYLRPHAGLRTDGLQYAPAFGPGSDWQLYNGEGFTASVKMPPNEWVPVRVEILGRRARVFYGDLDTPILTIDKLKHEPVAGPIGIRSAPNPSAYFADFRVTPTDDLSFPPVVVRRQPRGLIREWELSQTFRATDVDGGRAPDAALRERIEWRRVTTEENGLLNISRHAARSTNGEADLVFARVFLEAEQDEVRRFSFGYSDWATVLLNDRLLFTGNSSYLARSREYAGIISLEDQLHLPLKAGRNELLFLVAETFGGWGLMGQDNDDDFFRDGIIELWHTETGNRLPESVLHDPERDVLYVSHYFRGGNEYISRLALDGTELDREWVGGLARPTGLFLHDGRLWAVDRRHLVEIDVDRGEIVARHAIPGAVFPNDVTFADDGTGYVTDTEGSRIYRFRDGEFEIWREGGAIDRPNVIHAEGDALLFGNSDDGRLQRIDRTDGSLVTVAELGPGGNVDGVRPDGKGGYLVSDFGGRIFRVGPGGELTEWIDTTASGTRAADFEFVSERGLLIVPGLFDNRITAYRCEGL